MRHIDADTKRALNALAISFVGVGGAIATAFKILGVKAEPGGMAMLWQLPSGWSRMSLQRALVTGTLVVPGTIICYGVVDGLATLAIDLGTTVWKRRYPDKSLETSSSDETVAETETDTDATPVIAPAPTSIGTVSR